MNTFTRSNSCENLNKFFRPTTFLQSAQFKNFACTRKETERGKYFRPGNSFRPLARAEFRTRNFQLTLEFLEIRLSAKGKFRESCLARRFSAQICSTMANSLREFAPFCAIFGRSTGGHSDAFSRCAEKFAFFLRAAPWKKLFFAIFAREKNLYRDLFLKKVHFL